ncbi:hypothetical protein N0V92_005767 [Colletotrichum tropicale]|nr:hypothetical protein N0V92_005767 [Colletotrichum tropicale]
MRTISAHVLSAVVLVLSGAGAGARALDIHEELQMGWKMGLLPRQATQNLQTFTGNLGGVAASAVRLFFFSPMVSGQGGSRFGGSEALVASCGASSVSGSGSVLGRRMEGFLTDGALLQITKSNDPSRPFEVDGDTFVSSLD